MLDLSEIRAALLTMALKKWDKPIFSLETSIPCLNNSLLSMPRETSEKGRNFCSIMTQNRLIKGTKT